MDLTAISIISGLIGLFYVVYLLMFVSSHKIKKERTRKITNLIHIGAMAYLKSQYTLLSIFVIIVAMILWIFSGWGMSLAFTIGAFLSAISGYLGMTTATSANGRTAETASVSIKKALKVAFSSGSVTGITVASLGLIGLGLTFGYLNAYMGIKASLESIIGFGFGASTVALFARVGGGIYTKAADVGADLVGKVETGIPEDDPRNPAVIADNVGDNVGDIAGMGADLFESYVDSIIAAMILGFYVIGYSGLSLPIKIASIGLLSSIIGTRLVKTKSSRIKDLLWGLRIGSISTILLTLIGTFFIMDLNLFLAVTIGCITGLLIGFSTEYYTSPNYSNTKFVAKAAKDGAGINVIAGLSVGMKSTIAPVLVVAAALLLATYVAGIYGVAIAAVGMLATLGITLSSDAYGPVADNAGGIAKMAGLGAKTRKKTDALDAIGNTTAAVSKGFAIGSAALTALALLIVFIQKTGLNASEFTIADPLIVAGLIIGAMMPFAFSSSIMESVGKTAEKIVEEVRRQFRKKKILKGKGKPDYERCVGIASKHAIKEMIYPGLLAIITPLLIGFLLGPKALAGLLMGATATGFVVAVFMANAGGSWDNAKKIIERGSYGGPGSAAHKSAVIGDTVGDPLKDSSGPSLNILIKLMSIIALVISSMI